MPRSERSDQKCETCTLAIDIGGSHLKAGVLNASGEMTCGPERVVTPKPAKPADLVAALFELAKRLGPFGSVSIGFPGVVRMGHVVTAPDPGDPGPEVRC